MNAGFMEGMIWAGLLLIVLPLVIGIVVAIIVYQHRGRPENEDSGREARQVWPAPR